MSRNSPAASPRCSHSPWQSTGRPYVAPDHIRHDQVIRAVVTKVHRPHGSLMGVDENDLMRLEQPGKHRGNFFAAIWGPRNACNLRDVPGVADGDSTKRLHPLGDLINQP